MRETQRRLQVEELESRTLLAAGALTGALHGTYAARHLESFGLTGSGRIVGLGRVALNGSVRLAGVAVGDVAGRLTLVNPHGNLTLGLEATTVPDEFAFHVLRGTRAYRHLSGDGTIDLRLGTSAFALQLQPGPAQPTPPSSLKMGVFGVVTEGPISPVSRPGEPNSRPVPGAIVSVQPAGGGPEILRVTADALGNYQIALDPGSYRLLPMPPDPNAYFPRGIPQDVTIGPDKVLNVNLTMDTDIR